MEGLLLIAGIIGVVILPILTIVAFIQIGWLYSIISVSFVAICVFLLYVLWKRESKNSNSTQHNERAEFVSKIATRFAVLAIILGALMFVACFVDGPTGYVGTFTQCGWCGGSGIVSSGKICGLCNGRGGAAGGSARYTSSITNWLGVVLATSGVVIIFAVKKLKKKFGKQK